ncbi:MAG: iron-sulfur cluster assembly accessory protein [Deltaproteobacteria bacterium]|nr:MAG: iron-sulfur cluster assembly accessory protein [Deltaproteobacteria bacterium]
MPAQPSPDEAKRNEAPLDEAPTQRPASGPVRLTEAARERMKAALAEEGKDGYGIRIGVVGGGCAGFQYALDFENTARPGDTVWEEAGLTLYVDKLSVMYLTGTEIDFVTDLLGAGFKFSNPNVTTTCGCGQSFA